jgi:multidrug efflux system membrane fusion protein
LALALALCAGCHSGSAAPQKKKAPVQVEVAVVVDKPMPFLVDATGTVEAFSTVSITPQVRGEILKVGFEEGASVKKGDTLFTIDTRPYRASLDQARAQLAKDEAIAKQAADDVERAMKLQKEGLATEQEAERARSAASMARATLDADRAAIEGKSVDVDLSTVHAPIDGRTGSLLVHVGNVVDPSGAPLVVIRQMKPAYVRFSVPERYLPLLRARVGRSKIVVRARRHGSADGDAAAGATAGELSLIENTVDTATGTIALKAAFANDDEALWPGEFVDVSVQISVDPHALVVPASAVQAGDGGDHVFVIGSDDKIEVRSVTVTGRNGEEAVLSTGVSAGERVATSGHMRLSAGAQVIAASASTSDASAAPATTYVER